MNLDRSSQRILGIASRGVFNGDRFKYYWSEEDAAAAEEVGWYASQLVGHIPKFDSVRPSTRLTLLFYKKGTIPYGTIVNAEYSFYMLTD